MFRKTAVVFALCLLFTLISINPAHSEVYTLEKCVATALENNYGVIAAKNYYDVARSSVKSTYADLLPSIGISASRSQSWSGVPRLDPTTGIITFGTTSYSGGLSIGQTYGGLGLYNIANIKRSKAQRNSAQSSLVGAKNNLVLSVKQEYYLRVVQSRYDLGSASMSDVLKAKVQYGNDRLDQVGKKNNVNLSKAQLAFTMGVDVNSDFEIDDKLSERQIEISFNEALSEALVKNPDYQKAGFDLHSSNAQKTMAYSAFLPSLRLSLSHSTNVFEIGDLTNFEKADASYFFSASLSFNIFNSLNDMTNLKSAKKDVNTKHENLKNTKNAVALEVKQAFLNLENTAEARNLAEESVAAAQEDLNLVKEKYNLGAATILEVLDAEVSYKQAQTSHVEVLYDYNLAVSQLEKALGR
jgi:outer membrane protein TolC